MNFFESQSMSAEEKKTILQAFKNLLQGNCTRPGISKEVVRYLNLCELSSSSSVDEIFNSHFNGIPKIRETFDYLIQVAPHAVTSDIFDLAAEVSCITSDFYGDVMGAWKQAEILDLELKKCDIDQEIERIKRL